jgi:hypothetical protein
MSYTPNKLFMFVFLLLPFYAFGQDTIATYSLRQFASLGWLSGSWRSQTSQGRTHYQTIVLQDDSTIVLSEYADSAMTSPRGRSRIVFRSRMIYYYDSAVDWRLARMDKREIYFLPTHGDYPRFSWKWESHSSCVHTMQYRSKAGKQISRVFRMQRISR